MADNGFKMIFSNYDAAYLDFVFEDWIYNGNNLCSPYKEWQVQHQNDHIKMLKSRNVSNLELAIMWGGEVAMWTEQVDGLSMMS